MNSTHRTHHSMSQSRLIVVADDLTGAADCAARCHGAGIAATIFVTPPTRPIAAGASCLTTDSRHLSAQDAAGAVRSLLGRVSDAADALCYKKIDSTLRGNIGAELEVMLAWAGAEYSLVCPAFPAQGRGLEHGRLVLNGETQPAHLPTLLAAQVTCAVAAIESECVRAGAAAVSQAIGRALADGATLLVCDATTEADLAVLLDAVALNTQAPLLCGSAGLLGVVARRLAAALPLPSAPIADASGRPVLAVVGSGSAMAQQQIEAVAASGSARLCMLAAEMEPQEVVAAVAQAPGNWLLHLPPAPPTLRLDGAIARQQALRLADAAAAVVFHFAPGRLILCGGDTATTLLARLGVSQVQVTGELFPGMPLGMALAADGQSHTIVLKAGNHGDAQTLVQLIEPIIR